MTLHDAHNHLQHPRLAPFLDDAVRSISAAPYGECVVNGTQESDWQDVRNLSGRYSWIVPSYGVHPWYVGGVSSEWERNIRALLQDNSKAAVGEIGLDRWIEGHDLQIQIPIFSRQLALAAELDRPVTIHCVRAWGALQDVLRTAPKPAKGFLLHAYSGPAEMTQGFVDQGAYFSFSPYFLHDRKAAQREVFQHLPLNRILVETDAPDLAPPADLTSFPIYDPDGKLVSHPANLLLAYEALAELRGMSVPELASVVADNFTRLFASTGS